MRVRLNNTKVKLPQSIIVDKIKRTISYHIETKSTIDKLQNAIRDLIYQHKIEAPNFKAELWYVSVIDGRLIVKYGHELEPQIIVE